MEAFMGQNYWVAGGGCGPPALADAILCVSEINIWEITCLLLKLLVLYRLVSKSEAQHGQPQLKLNIL